MIYDCIIIGAGPAGIISSIQLKRAGFNVLLFEKNKIGGLLHSAGRIENYLGFVGGLPAKELVSIFEKQLRSFNVNIVKSEVVEIRKKRDFIVYVSNDEYRCKSVIVATGTKPKSAKIEMENMCNEKVFYDIGELPSRGVNKKIIIIGGGDVGFDYALSLYGRGYRPIIMTKNKVKCLELLKKRANKRKIRCFEHNNPKIIRKSGNGVEVVCGKKIFKSDYLLFAIGRRPTYPKINSSDKKEIYFAGDVHNNFYRQVHIATGDALLTAMKVTNYLKNGSNKRNRKR